MLIRLCQYPIVTLRRGTPNGVQSELAPLGEPYAGVAPCSPYKWIGMCGSVYGYPASKISLGPPWMWRLCSYSPPFVLSPRIIMLCHCLSSTMTKGHLLLISYSTRWPLCVDVPLNTYSFIQSYCNNMVLIHPDNICIEMRRFCVWYIN